MNTDLKEILQVIFRGQFKKIYLKSMGILFFVFAFSVKAFPQQLPDNVIKTNVTRVYHSIDKLIQLEPVYFEYDTKKFSYLHLKSGSRFGFMADNVEKVFPELVIPKHFQQMVGKNIYKDASIKTIDEMGLIPLLVAAIKEQQAQIEKLKSDISELKKGTSH